MSDLILLPDVEFLVMRFLRDQEEVAAFFEAGVDNVGHPVTDPPTDRVYTDLPKSTNPTVWPLVRVTRVTGAPRTNRPAWIDQAFVQIEGFGGSRRLARALTETCRAVLDRRLVGVHDEGVVNNIRTQSFGHHPDDTYQPARQKYDFLAVITLHPNPAAGGS